MLSTQIITKLLAREKKDSSTQEKESEAKKLDEGFVLSQALDPRDLAPPVGVDLIVVLSGRSDFKRKYMDNPTRPPNARDLNDTRRRMIYGIALAKYCTAINKLNGVDKPVKIYFNGIPEVNKQLLGMLRRPNGMLGGYPCKLFIVDNIPVMSTIGQVIGLSKFIEESPDMPASPKILITTSTYHLFRSAKAFGNSSPLHSPEFYLKNPDFIQKMPQAFQRYVSTLGNKLKNAQIDIYGCDRDITANIGWIDDLKGDMEAVYYYSTLQETASISREFPSNVVTLSRAIMRDSLYKSRPLSNCNETNQHETTKKLV